jgi:hypothetical protein
MAWIIKLVDRFQQTRDAHRDCSIEDPSAVYPGLDERSRSISEQRTTRGGAPTESAENASETLSKRVGIIRA